MRRLLLVGCGFLGKATARTFQNTGWEILPVTHSEESAEALRSEGWPAVAADIGDEHSVRQLQKSVPPISAWLHCASSGGAGADGYRRVYLQGVRNLCASFPEARRLFTSSTSVYAQTDGSSISEESIAEPPRETGRLLLEAEREVLRQGGTVLRLAGIYGPGRSVLLKKFLLGDARLEAGGLRWINQIHRDDAASAWLFLAENNPSPGIFNGVDNQPMRQIDLYTEMAARLNAPLPPDGPVDLNRKRGWTSKKVSNAKLRSLGWNPEFPNYFSDWQRLIATVAAA
jgi:nucleoside-diphosphate-sugar epimerase